MGQAFDFFIDMFRSIIYLLSAYTIRIWTFEVSIFGLLSALMITGFIICIFWKGAKT